ncbi:MAG: shikimate dehydrogenase [Actinobacteria bacterium]|nr:shikimate dehydrogenase [Actinomycetota bacterium]
MHPEGFAMSARTGLLGVIGHPVGHSLSPRLHNAALRSQGVDLVYLAFDVEPVQLSAAVSGLRALGVRGANVTVPHKEAVVAMLDQLDPMAARVGAVNTIVNDSGRLIGHNTDVHGFAAALRCLLPDGARGLRCVVAGAGGAARAVVAALIADGAARITICNRTLERAVELCRVAQNWGPPGCAAVPQEESRTLLADADLLVNATAVGLSLDVKDFPLPVDTLHSGLVVVDVVYGTEPTALVQAARQRGARAMDGVEMLLMQAGCSYRLWTGLEPPIGVMRESMELEEG